MKIYHHKKFKKQYQKLPPVLKKKTDITLRLFAKNPFDIALKNHSLSGRLNGKRAISVTGNLRIIFEEYHDYTVVLMLTVGTHPQVYE